jgi:protein gp37
MKNKIGWCDITWNPVWGCLNHCEYCYARKIAKRFWKQMIEIEFNHHWKKYPTWVWTGDYLSNLKDFKPTFLDAQFAKDFPKKSQRIFVGSMSEIYYWKDKWLEKVLEKVKLYPQHTFQFLTRYPEVYDRYIFPKNCWLGVTITREKDFERRIPYLFITSCNITFVSIEPILEYINPGPFSNANIDWVIVGAETGNRKDKIIPKREWIENIVNYCKWNNVPIYLKDSLKNIYPGKIKMFP